MEKNQNSEQKNTQENKAGKGLVNLGKFTKDMLVDAVKKDHNPYNSTLQASPETSKAKKQKL